MIDFEKELSTEAMHALQNLRKHSECLSDIPPHFGSNKNERLHREIRAWFKNRTTVNLETALALLLINFTLWNRGKKGDNRPIMTESLGKLDQLHVPMVEMNEVDEVSVFDTNVGYVDIPEDLPLEILKLIGNLECFTLTSEHKAIELLLQTPFHKIPKCSDCKNSDESDILQKFGVEYKLPPAASPAFALSLNESKRPFIQHILVNDKMTAEQMLDESCDALKSVVILLSDSEELPVQTLLPKVITKSQPVIIYQSEDGFYLTHPKTLPEKFCTCGRDGKTKLCCKNRKCPCIDGGQKCNVQCKCYDCQNQSSEASKILVKTKRTACRCGRGRNRENETYVCTGDRCQCNKNIWSCEETPKCQCKKCGNVWGERIYQKKNDSRENLPKHHGKLRIAGSDDMCYSQEGLEKRDSKWTDEETVALFIIGKYFEKNDEILAVFNYLHQNMSSLQLREKTLPQILGKMSNINKYMCMYHPKCNLDTQIGKQ